MIHDLESRSIDFVLALPEAELHEDVYKELPFSFNHYGDRRYVMKLNKSIYGLKQAKSSLTQRDFFPSEIDPCIYYEDNCIVLVYVDDCIIFSKDKSVIDDLINSLMNVPDHCVLIDEGEIDKYLGINIDKSK